MAVGRMDATKSAGRPEPPQAAAQPNGLHIALGVLGGVAGAAAAGYAAYKGYQEYKFNGQVAEAKDRFYAKRAKYENSNAGKLADLDTYKPIQMESMPTPVNNFKNEGWDKIDVVPPKPFLMTPEARADRLLTGISARSKARMDRLNTIY